MPPEIQQVLFGHFVQIVSHHPDAPGVGTQQPGRHLHDQRLARTAFAKKHFGFPGPHLEGYVLQNVALIETDAHILERDEGFARNGLGLSLCRRRAREVGHTKDYRGIRRGFREGSIIFAALQNLRCLRGAGRSSRSRGNHDVFPKIKRRIFARKKSITKTITEEITTAEVVARPTPCVPPFTRSP